MTALSALFALTLAAGPLPSIDEDPMAWIYFDSRETENPPMLELELEGGASKSLVADRDSVLIEYLAEGAWGHLPELSVDRREKNRVLLHFPIEGGTAIVRATLVLNAHPSSTAPREPFPVAVHPLTESWTERRTSWSRAPAFMEQPVAEIEVPLEGGVVRLDVTEVASVWAADPDSNHGLLLRTSRPLEEVGGADSVLQTKVDEELVALFDWAEDLDDALERAEREGRELLVLVTGAFRDTLLTEQERLILATALCHPALRARVGAAFVPVRVRVSPSVVAMQLEGNELGGHPLHPLGLELLEARPPALLVASAEGEVLRARTRLGALHPGDLFQWLGGKKFGMSKRQDPPAARYDRAARAPIAEAAELLEAIEKDHPDSPWALKCRARRAFPALVGGFELLGPLPTPKGEAAILKRATRYLLESQYEDGSFPMGHPPFEEHRDGISALCALALLQRGETEAADRAARWIADRFEGLAPERINSFSAAYFLDLQLHRHAAKRAEEAEVEAAIDWLAAGQLSNGAWSYSKRFGDSWQGGFGGWPETDQGRAHSINTAIALEVLTRAKEAGFEVDEAVLGSGRDALLAMRVAPACYTYTYPEPRNFEELDASICKGPVAELGLWRLEAVPKKDLETAVEAFLAGREHLDAPRNLTASWVPPHGLSGYFHSCAYLHGAQAVIALGGSKKQARLRSLREDLLKRASPDGTWIDTIGLGRPYATAMAIRVIGASRE